MKFMDAGLHLTICRKRWSCQATTRHHLRYQILNLLTKVHLCFGTNSSTRQFETVLQCYGNLVNRIHPDWQYWLHKVCGILIWFQFPIICSIAILVVLKCGAYPPTKKVTPLKVDCLQNLIEMRTN